MNGISKATLRSQILSGLIWRFLERCGTQSVQFIVTVILARILLPEDFGTVALLSVFISIANVIAQGGWGLALIQKSEVCDGEYSSVFYLSLLTSVALYVLIFLLAPSIGMFYSVPLLSPVLRVMALSLVIGALNSIHNAKLSRDMNFHKSFFVNIGGAIAFGAVGIVMANCGYGVWSLVFSQLAGQVTSTIIIWITVRWRPCFIISIEKVKDLFRFGSNLLCSGLLAVVFNNLYPFIIGKFYDRILLGYYNRGNSIPSMLVENITGTISGVMFPAIASCQSDRAHVKKLVRRMVVTSSFLVFPMMLGLAVVAEPLVQLIYTDKWLPCVPFLQLSCLTYAVWPIHTANLQAIAAIGHSKEFLKLEIIKKILMVVVVVISAHFGVYVMVTGGAVLSLVFTFINAWPNRKLLDYAFEEQMLDIMPSIFLSVIMGFVIEMLSMLPFGSGLLLFLQVVVGSAFYFASAYYFKLESFTYLLKSIKNGITQI